MGATHGSDADVLGNGYVLSQFLKSAAFSGKRDTAETTTFKKNSKTYIPGLKDTTMSFDGIWDGVVDAIDDIFYAALNAGKGIFSYVPAGAELIGASTWTMDAISVKHDVNTAVGDVAQISAELSMAETGYFTRGKVSKPMFTEVAPGNSANLNNVVQSTNGGSLIVHAVTPSATLVVFLQDSADGTTFADIAGSITVTNAVRSSQRLVYAGTIRQYTRIRWTGTGQFLAITERF